MSKSLSMILDLANAANNPMRPTNLQKDLSDVVGSLVLLQAYARQSAQQPTIQASDLGDDVENLLPSLQQHQSDSKRNALSLLDTVTPQVVAGLTDIIAFSSMMEAFIGAATPLLPLIVDNPAARSQVLALMAQLQLEANRRQSSTQAVQARLAATLTKAQSEAKRFQSDVDAVTKAIDSEDGALAKARGDIDDINRKIGGEIAGVVVASLVVVGGGVVILVGVLATLPAGITAPAIILAGVGIMVTGTIGLTAAASLLASDNAKLASLYQKTSALSRTVAVSQAILSQLSSMSDSVSGLEQSVSALGNEWGAIHTGITQFMQDITRATDASDLAHLTTAMQMARQDWQALTEQAQQLTHRLVDLTPQESKDILSSAPAKSAA